MRKLTLIAALSLVAAAAARPALAKGNKQAEAARAEIKTMLGFVPSFISAVPEEALPGVWAELKALEASPDTAIPCRYKQLIGLAVAAQIPCKGCAYGHTKLARLNGATDAQIGEAVAVAGLARHWSTFFNGMQLDEGKFRAEIKQVMENIKKAVASNTPPPAPLDVVDQATALKDMEQTFGFVPEFARKFPAAALPGAWRQMRDVEMNPSTAVPGKYKSLISLAVAAQIPCRYCIIADTEFAKLEGATDQEIGEAVAMASWVRDWSTLLAGTQVDEAAYRRDMDRLVQALGKNMPRATARASR